MNSMRENDLVQAASRGTVVAVGVVCQLMGLAFAVLSAVLLFNSRITAQGTTFVTAYWVIGAFFLLALGLFGCGVSLCLKDDGSRVLVGSGFLRGFAVVTVLGTACGLVFSFFQPQSNPSMYVRPLIGSLTFAGAAFLLARKRKAANHAAQVKWHKGSEPGR